MIRSTLLCDGSSDRALTRIIDWALFQNGVRAELISQWADLRGLKLEKGLRPRLIKALDLYPCNLLFVHRDAENEPAAKRLEEVKDAISGLTVPPYVAVVPVRMQEAWLLCDESAIRKAAGNPASVVQVNLPKITAVEGIADPKQTLFECLKTASERTGRRLRQFNVESARSQVTEHIDDFSTLRVLPSFQQFENDLKALIQANHLDTWK